MEEELLQGGVCGGNLWNSSRNNLFASSPCSSAVHGGVGSFGWSNIGGDTKTSGGGSVVEKPHHLGGWSQDLVNESGRSQENYSYILHALNSSMNCRTSNYYSDSSSMNSNPSFPIQPNSFPLINYNLYDQSLLDYHQMNSTQLPGNNFHFINNTPFWNATAAGDIPARQILPNSSIGKPNATANAKHRNEKAANESAIKRPRTETPSPLPAFKVRKEKLGDRVTALQQLVSPFGKTDTASVLHEAIEYIKLLHDQVTVLSTPYLQNGSTPLQCQKDQEEATKELRSRGLCLVPIASTFPVAAEASPDFWAPTFGGSFR